MAGNRVMPGHRLDIVNASKWYKKTKAVDHINLSVNNGEFLTILGPSGSGKTSLLTLIAGFETLNSGSILLNHQDISAKKAYERDIGMVFQNYALFPHMTVFDNIAYPLRIRRTRKEDVNNRVKEILKLVHLETYEMRYPKQLSGGQQQRVALARAIVFNPPLLLLDEPLAALDKNLRQQMQLEIKQIQEKVGITTICVTHDQEEALTMSDRICVMNRGRIEQIDTPENLYQKPKNRFVAEFIGEINLIQGKLVEVTNGIAKLVIFDQQKAIVSVEGNHPDARGKTVHMALRPENVRIATEKSMYDNTITVTVNELIYVGEGVKVKALTSTDEIITVKVPALQAHSLSRGEDILLGWNRHDVSLLYDE
ncbi:ABC transporter ATP-binding protein [Brevibacillus sp. NRS-1366]|uniref:ABC transporter ATP-binding protein n=1 Tax=Brevibacillus sp. NRS-1366 TaxID=3233899 RepID=UPI003D1AAC02